MNPGPEPDAAPDPHPGTPPADEAIETENHPARELSAHLLRMLETRMEAASIAVQGEVRLLVSRLQLKLLVGVALFLAVWAGIVLLAIVLPEAWRVPVLGAVVAGFVLLAIVAHLAAAKRASSDQVGSIHWFLDSLRQDLELLTRAVSRQPPQPRTTAPPDRSPPHDLAA